MVVPSSLFINHIQLLIYSFLSLTQPRHVTRVSTGFWVPSKPMKMFVEFQNFLFCPNSTQPLDHMHFVPALTDSFCNCFLPLTACLPLPPTSCLDFAPPEAPVYQAASPDEEALVGAARELGWVFLSRTRDSVVVSELGIPRQYQLLALLDFTSQRRRMSVLGQSRYPRLALMSKY